MVSDGAACTATIAATCLILLLSNAATVTLTSNETIITKVDDPGMVNLIWLHNDDVASINYNTLASGRITDIAVLTADWTSAHTLNMLLSSSQITAMLTAAHARDIKVHAWTIRFWGDGQPALDISSSAQRSACISAVSNLMQTSYGGHYFDGHNDDLSEHFSGSWQNYVDYLSGLTSVLHGLGKISSVDMLVWTGYPVEARFPTLSFVDYICGMFYSDQTWSQTDFNATVPRAFTYTPVPLVIGMYYDSRVGPYTPAQQLNYVGDTYNDEPDFGGFALYSGDSGGWNYIDWSSWNLWTPKDGEEAPSPPNSLAIVAATILFRRQ